MRGTERGMEWNEQTECLEREEGEMEGRKGEEKREPGKVEEREEGGEEGEDVKMTEMRLTG